MTSRSAASCAPRPFGSVGCWSRLAPDDAEARGLLALMLLQDSRRAARVDADGRLVPLGEQDRRKWDLAQIAEGRALVAQALTEGFAGPYRIQAAIAAVHSESTSDEQTDWAQIQLLYRMLELAAPSPTVTLNRAVAVARCDGPEAGLAVVDGLAARGELVDHHRLASVRAHLLEDAGRPSEARAEYVRAAGLTSTPAERAYLLDRAARLSSLSARLTGQSSDQRGEVVRGGKYVPGQVEQGRTGLPGRPGERRPQVRAGVAGDRPHLAGRDAVRRPERQPVGPREVDAALGVTGHAPGRSGASRSPGRRPRARTRGAAPGRGWPAPAGRTRLRRRRTPPAPARPVPAAAPTAAGSA